MTNRAGSAIMRIDLGDDFGNNATYDFGMTILHELNHSYFGLGDAFKGSFKKANATNPEMYRGTGYYSIPTAGETVEIVNVYRREMGLPERVSYPRIYEGVLFKRIVTKEIKKRKKIKIKRYAEYFFI